MSRREFFDHYFAKHAHDGKAALAKTFGGLEDLAKKMRYTLSVVLSPAKTEWAGIVELWLPEEDHPGALQRFLDALPEDATWQRLRERGPSFSGHPGVVGLP